MTNMPDKTFDQLLLECIALSDVSVVDLAKRIGVNRKTLQRYQSGESRPDVVMLHKICDALEVDDTMRAKLYASCFTEALSQEEKLDLRLLTGGGSVLGMLLRAAREAKGLGTKDIPKLADVDRTTYMKFEEGSRVPTNETLNGLLDAMNVPQDKRLYYFTATVEPRLKHIQQLTKRLNDSGAQLITRVKEDVLSAEVQFPSLKNLRKDILKAYNLSL